MSDNFDAFTNPNNTVINGAFTVQSDLGAGGTSVSFDNGAIQSDGYGDLIANSFVGIGSNGLSSVYNVMAYGAKGNGVTDDTAAIQAALNAVKATSGVAGRGGGIVYLPPGSYITSASLIIKTNYTILQGAGVRSTVIVPVAGATFDVISTPIPTSTSQSGFTKEFLGIKDLKIDCVNMAGTVAGQGNAIHTYGMRHSVIQDILITACKNWCILLDGDNGPNFNFSYNNHLLRCEFDVEPGGGLWVTNSEANSIVECLFNQCGTGCVAAQPALGSQVTTSYHLWIGTGFTYVQGCVFGGGNTTTPAIHMDNGGTSRIEGNRFDHSPYQAIEIVAGSHIINGNQIGAASNVGSVEAIRVASSNNIITNNQFGEGGAHTYTYCILEPSSQSGNLIQGNRFQAGTSGVLSLNAASTDIVAHNVGYNPVGSITPPAVPSTTVAYTNKFGVDCTVFITGGTVTVIAIGGTTTGLTSGAFRVPANQTITITYSVVPTWTWFGD